MYINSQYTFVLQLEGSVEAKSNEIASKDVAISILLKEQDRIEMQLSEEQKQQKNQLMEEQIKMSKAMENKLLEQQKNLKNKFLDKQIQMELEMEAQLKKSREDAGVDGKLKDTIKYKNEEIKLGITNVSLLTKKVAELKAQLRDGDQSKFFKEKLKEAVEFQDSVKAKIADKDGRISSLEGQLKELKSDMKQVEKDAVAAIKQQMQQHAKADEEVVRKDLVISALTAKIEETESYEKDYDRELRQNKTRQISLETKVDSLKSQLGDKCKELSKLRRVFLEERAAKRDQDTAIKKRNRIIYLKVNSTNNRPKSEEKEDQTEFTDTANNRK